MTCPQSLREERTEWRPKRRGGLTPEPGTLRARGQQRALLLRAVPTFCLSEQEGAEGRLLGRTQCSFLKTFPEIHRSQEAAVSVPGKLHSGGRSQARHGLSLLGRCEGREESGWKGPWGHAGRTGGSQGLSLPSGLSTLLLSPDTPGQGSYCRNPGQKRLRDAGKAARKEAPVGRNPGVSPDSCRPGESRHLLGFRFLFCEVGAKHSLQRPATQNEMEICVDRQPIVHETDCFSDLRLKL